MSDKFLLTHTLLYVSVRHMFISLTSFVVIPNSIRILYKTSLLTESYTFLKSINSWSTALLYSYFFSSIWWLQNMWLVVVVLRRNPHWWFPIISSEYGINLHSRMLVKIWYVVDKNDMHLYRDKGTYFIF